MGKLVKTPAPHLWSAPQVSDLQRLADWPEVRVPKGRSLRSLIGQMTSGSRGTIVLDEGDYYVYGAVSLLAHQLHIRGGAGQASRLVLMSDNPLTLAGNDIVLEDLTLDLTQTSIRGCPIAAVIITGNRNTLRHVYCDGGTMQVAVNGNDGLLLDTMHRRHAGIAVLGTGTGNRLIGVDTGNNTSGGDEIALLGAQNAVLGCIADQGAGVIVISGGPTNVGAANRPNAT